MENHLLVFNFITVHVTDVLADVLTALPQKTVKILQ